MKLHQSLIIAAILSIFVIPSLTYALTPKRTLEQYANLTREATEQGNYLRIEELAQDMSKDYKGEIAEINAKGYLFNLYQGKCGRAISNGFPHPSASDENLPKCRALTNMQKTIDMAEELIEDLEAYLNSGKPLLAEEKEWIYGQISYLSKRLGPLYSKGKYVNKNESKALKYQKLYEKYEQLSQ